jgi:hypothetical protein
MTSIHYDGPDTSQQEHLSPEFHMLVDANPGHWIKEAFYSFVYVLKQWQARCQKETNENSITSEQEWVPKDHISYHHSITTNCKPN